MESTTTDVFELISDVAALTAKADQILSDVPRAASVYNSLLMKIKGYSDDFNFYSLKKHPSSRTVYLKEKTTQTTMGVYCPVEDEGNFLAAVSETSLIDWTQDMVCFQYVPESLVGKLELVMKEKSNKPVGKSGGDLYVYDAPQGADVVNLYFSIPARYSVKRLGTAGVRQMHSVWRYRQCSDVNTYIQLCKLAPNAGIYEDTSALEEKAIRVLSDGLEAAPDDGEAVAWVSSTAYGPMGLLGVHSSIKEESKSELENFVTRACALLMIKEKFVVHSYLEPDDTSIRNMEGWTKRGTGTWMWCSDENVCEKHD